MKFLGNLSFKTIGSDPEFFIIKNKQAFPSCLFLKEEKNALINNTNFKLFKDNLLLEGNIPPAVNSKNFISNMAELYWMINNLLKYQSAKIIHEDAMKFAPRFLKLPDAYNFGCSGYFNTWDEINNDFLITKIHSTPVLKGPMRTAGFHIHLGMDYQGEYQNNNNGKTKNLQTDLKDTPLEKIIKFHINRIVTRVFDLLVTNPSRHVYVNKERAKGYGQFGAFRNTPYGVECRSLGGYFTQIKYLRWVAEQSIKAVNHTNMLIKKNPDALIHFSKNIKFDVIDNIFLNPSLYKAFNLNYNDEIQQINEIAKKEDNPDKRFFDKVHQSNSSYEPELEYDFSY